MSRLHGMRLNCTNKAIYFNVKTKNKKSYKNPNISKKLNYFIGGE